MLRLGSLLKQFIPPSVIVQKLNISGNILLTFDDGPHPDITPRVLDLLDKYDARGLFFVPGNRIKNAPNMLQEILDRNHGIGNHSYTHTPCSNLSYSSIVHEIEQCRDTIFSLTGITTELYRPPLGIITPSLIVAAKRCKHKIIRWSFDSGEYSYLRDTTSSVLADNFINNGIKDKAIVLSHDDKDTIPDFLELILPRLVDKGFDLKNGLESIGWKYNTAKGDYQKEFKNRSSVRTLSEKQLS